MIINIIVVMGEIESKLYNEMIIILTAAAQYEKYGPIIREYNKSKSETDDVIGMMSEEASK